MQLECVGTRTCALTMLFLPGVSRFSWVMLMSAALIIKKKEAYFVCSSGVFWTSEDFWRAAACSLCP